MLHKYANEDVSLGSWFIGLDVEHIDDRRICCGSPPGIYVLLFLHSKLGYDHFLMVSDSVVTVQIVSGRLKQVIRALLHLIGNAAGFAGLL